MTCEMMEDLLEAYADRQATLPEISQVEAHLGECLGCRKTLRWIEATKAVVREASTPAIPRDLKKTLLDAAARRQEAAQQGWLSSMRDFLRARTWQAGLATACAAAAVMLIARFAAGPRDLLPLDAVLAAHNEYARTMPLSCEEQILSELPDRMGTQSEDHEL